VGLDGAVGSTFRHGDGSTSLVSDPLIATDTDAEIREDAS
jgi:hypothetical protein